MSRERVTITAKNAIEALLLILRHHASSLFSSSSSSFHANAELLRLGKHDVADASMPLWRCIKDLLDAFFQPVPFLTSSSSSSFCSSSIIEDVIIQLMLLEYPNIEALLRTLGSRFNEREGGGKLRGGGCGGGSGCSRELTIVFGWLLARFQLPTRLFPFHHDDANDDNNVYRKHETNGESNRNESNAASEERTTTGDDEPHQQRDQWKRLQWELGKLNLTQRKWIQTREKKAALIDKVHAMTAGSGIGRENSGVSRTAAGAYSATVGVAATTDCRSRSAARSSESTSSTTAEKGSSAGKSLTSLSSSPPPSSFHLSVAEASILSDPRNYREASKYLDDHLKYLKAWQLWMIGGGSKIFWKWMQSVVEAKERGGGRGEEEAVGERKEENEGDEVREVEAGVVGLSDLTPRLASMLKLELTNRMKTIHSALELNGERIEDVLRFSSAPDSHVDGRDDVEFLRSRVEKALDRDRLKKTSFPAAVDRCGLAAAARDVSMTRDLLRKRVETLHEEKRVSMEKKTKLCEEFDPTELLENCIVLPPLSLKFH